MREGDVRPVSNVIRSWVGNAPDEALAWIERLSDAKQKGPLLSTAVTTLAATDPARALRTANTLSPEARDHAVPRVVALWAQKDPSAAAQILLSLPDTPARIKSMGPVAHSWAQRDPARAAVWLNTLPAGDGRDAAVQSFANAVQRTDPEGAAAWATTLSNPDQRKLQVENIARAWLQNDTDAAKRWLASTVALTEEAKQRLLENVQ